MKQQDFNRLFPKADPNFFKPDYDETMVFVDPDGSLVGIESFSFWDNKDHVKLLRLPPIGMKWWSENRGNFLTEWKRLYKYRKLDHDDLFPLDYSPKPLGPPPQSWGPQEWNTSNAKSPPSVSLVHPEGINIESFHVYVNDTQFFMLQEKLPWNLTDIEKINFRDPKMNIV